MKELHFNMDEVQKANIHKKERNSGEIVISDEYIDNYLYLIFGDERKQEDGSIIIYCTDILLRRPTVRIDKTGGHDRERVVVYVPNELYKKYKSVWIKKVVDENYLELSLDNKKMYRTRVRKGKDGVGVKVPKKFHGKNVSLLFELKW